MAANQAQKQCTCIACCTQRPYLLRQSALHHCTTKPTTPAGNLHMRESRNGPPPGDQYQGRERTGAHTYTLSQKRIHTPYAKRWQDGGSATHTLELGIWAIKAYGTRGNVRRRLRCTEPGSSQSSPFRIMVRLWARQYSCPSGLKSFMEPQHTWAGGAIPDMGIPNAGHITHSVSCMANKHE